LDPPIDLLSKSIKTSLFLGSLSSSRNLARSPPEASSSASLPDLKSSWLWRYLRFCYFAKLLAEIPVILSGYPPFYKGNLAELKTIRDVWGSLEGHI
jgi:hypothetical protein